MQLKRRLTLGWLMILIALLAVPLALYAQHAREEQALLELDKNLRALVRQRHENPQSYACTPVTRPAKIEYLEYGSFDQEALK